MLVLGRAVSEGFSVTGPCRIVVVKVEHGRVTLGIEAPAETVILRDELVVKAKRGAA